MGNTDVRMSTARLDEPRTPDLPPSYAMELWCVDQLTSADRAFIQTFPLTIAVPLDHQMSLLAFHGSPHANTDLLFATTPEPDLPVLLGDLQATILAGGHTHVQLVRRYRDMVIVNPGSVGLPFEQPVPSGPIRRPPWAEYAMVSVRQGRVSIDCGALSSQSRRCSRALREVGCHIQNDGYTIGHVLDRQADLFQPAPQQALAADRFAREILAILTFLSCAPRRQLNARPLGL